jgi:hypothetical protein
VTGRSAKAEGAKRWEVPTRYSALGEPRDHGLQRGQAHGAGDGADRESTCTSATTGVSRSRRSLAARVPSGGSCGRRGHWSERADLGHVERDCHAAGLVLRRGLPRPLPLPSASDGRRRAARGLSAVRRVLVTTIEIRLNLSDGSGSNERRGDPDRAAARPYLAGPREEHRVWLQALIGDLGANLVVFDSLRRLMPSKAENESDDMAPNARSRRTWLSSRSAICRSSPAWSKLSARRP